jgi:molybdate transport system permease protein
MKTAYKDDQLFNGFFVFILLCYVLFIFIITGSVLFYTEPNVLIKNLFSKETLFAVKLSLSTSLFTTIIAILLSIPTGYCLSRFDFRGKDILDTIIDLPIVLPPLVMGLCLLVFFNTRLGQLIESHGIRFVFTVSGIILAQFAISASFAIRAMKLSFDNLDPKYEEAARTLGCNNIQTFLKITLPMVKMGLVSGAVMTWTRAVGEFVPILLLCGAQRMKTEIMPIAIFLKFEVGDIEGAVALTILFLFLTSAYLIVFKKMSTLSTKRLHQ